MIELENDIEINLDVSDEGKLKLLFDVPVPSLPDATFYLTFKNVEDVVQLLNYLQDYINIYKE